MNTHLTSSSKLKPVSPQTDKKEIKSADMPLKVQELRSQIVNRDYQITLTKHISSIALELAKNPYVVAPLFAKILQEGNEHHIFDIRHAIYEAHDKHGVDMTDLLPKLKGIVTEPETVIQFSAAMDLLKHFITRGKAGEHVRETAKEFLIEQVRELQAKSLLYRKPADWAKLNLLALGLVPVLSVIPKDIQEIVMVAHFNTTSSD